MKTLILMLQFFTRIPINKSIEVEENSFSNGIIYFPIVGLVIGLINGAVYFFAYRLFNGAVAILWSLLSNLLITGALHLDGLADTCDGIYSARSKDKMIEIMKDSRVGTNGVIAIFFDLMFRFCLLQRIGGTKLLALIIVLPIIARSILGLFIYLSAKDGNGKGLGSLFLRDTSLKIALVTLLLGMFISTIFIGYLVPIAFVVACVFVAAFRKYILVKLGVITGDILGATIEAVEILMLFLFAMLRRLI